MFKPETCFPSYRLFNFVCFISFKTWEWLLHLVPEVSQEQAQDQVKTKFWWNLSWNTQILVKYSRFSALFDFKLPRCEEEIPLKFNISLFRVNVSSFFHVIRKKRSPKKTLFAHCSLFVSSSMFRWLFMMFTSPPSDDIVRYCDLTTVRCRLSEKEVNRERLGNWDT